MNIRLITLIFTFLGCTHSLSQESQEIKNNSPSTKTYRAPTYITWEQWLEKSIRRQPSFKSLVILALTSSGGFHGGGAGNYFVLVDEKTYKGHLWVTPPMHAPKLNSEVPLEEITVSKSKVAEFLEKKDSFSSQAYSSRGFDLYRYTWTQFNFSDNKLLRVSQPVTFDDPFIGKQGSKRHQEIVNAFKYLKGTEQKK